MDNNTDNQTKFNDMDEKAAKKFETPEKLLPEISGAKQEEYEDEQFERETRECVRILPCDAEEIQPVTPMCVESALCHDFIEDEIIIARITPLGSGSFAPQMPVPQPKPRRGNYNASR